MTTRKYHYYCANCHDDWSSEHIRGDGPCPHCEFDTVREIVVHFEFPPIPRRDFDFCAYFDGDEERCEYGWGTTRAEAVNDLIANWGEAS